MPRILDLYCGAGGCSVGYHRAGFDVVGVDLHPQPNYPYEFIQMDALAYSAWDIEGFDAIHASPPCQAHTVAKVLQGRSHADLLTPTRALLEQTGLPWVIENVPGAPMRRDLILCGTQFGLEYRGFEIRRHRWFEFSDPRVAPLVSPCWHRLPPLYVYGHSPDKAHKRRYGYSSTKDWGPAMGIDWMNRDELAQAIPPAYTELIGHQLATYLQAAA